MKHLRKFNESFQSLEQIVLNEFKFMIQEYGIEPKSENSTGETYDITGDDNEVTLEIFKSQNSIEWQKIKNGSPKYMNYIFDLRKFINRLEEKGLSVDENKKSHKHKVLTISRS
jgi:hypothetical protein